MLLSISMSRVCVLSKNWPDPKIRFVAAGSLGAMFQVWLGFSVLSQHLDLQMLQ